MADFVRVTLEKPWLDDPKRVITMRFGTSDAVIPAEMQRDDYQNDLTRPAPRVIPGKPIHYHLSFEPVKYRCSDCGEIDVESVCVMPTDAAMNFFGYWDLPDPAPAGTPPEMTRTYEKGRVARYWGDYKKRPRNLNVPNDWRNLDKIAAPAVPHVLIQRLDAMMRLAPNTDYRPWEAFAWEKDCVEDVWTKHEESKIVFASEADFNTKVAEAVAAALAARKAQPAGAR